MSARSRLLSATCWLNKRNRQWAVRMAASTVQCAASQQLMAICVLAAQPQLQRLSVYHVRIMGTSQPNGSSCLSAGIRSACAARTL
jgi:hypothetical protein